jgi:hypothetical protein
MLPRQPGIKRLKIKRLLEKPDSGIGHEWQHLSGKLTPGKKRHMLAVAPLINDAFDKFHPVHLGHINIRNDDIRTYGNRRTWTLHRRENWAYLRILIRQDFMPPALKCRSQQQENIRTIINNNQLHSSLFPLGNNQNHILMMADNPVFTIREYLKLR